VRTIFNFLGPLTNPARPTAQVVGVSDPHMLPLMAQVLARRGTRAMLFRGQDGIDELTTTGESVVFDVMDGVVRETSIDPIQLGLPPAGIDDLAGGDAETSAAIAREILAGGSGPRRDVVLLNAAAAFAVAGRATSIEHGLELAATSIDEGAAANTLERWIDASSAAAEA
jgi:anthranilate phosphoribosyltransferase